MSQAKMKSREAEFRRSKEDGEQMVHRLRDWEVGDTIFGYEVLTENGSSGKTFKRGQMNVKPAVAQASEAFEEAPAIGELSPGSEAFLWVAKIDSVRTEPRDPADPGEPPLKFAHLRDVTVLASKSGGE